MRIIMAAANCNPAVASHRAKYDGDFSVVSMLLDAHPLERTISTWHYNQKRGKTSARALTARLSVRAKARRQTTAPDGTSGLLCRSRPGWRQAAIFPLQGKIII
jgi:hypothetical protein